MGSHGQVSPATGGLGRLLRRGAGKIYRKLMGRSAPVAAQIAPAAAPARGLPDICTDPRRQPDPAEVARHQAEYEADVRHFREEVRRRGLGDADKFYWYHTVDLGGGLLTPGDYD